MEFETVNESLLKSYPDAPQSSIFSILWGLREGMVVRVAQTGNVARIAILRQQLEQGVYLADIQREEDDYPLGVAKVAASNVIEVLANRILEKQEDIAEAEYVVVRESGSLYIARIEESGLAIRQGAVLYYEGEEPQPARGGQYYWMKRDEVYKTNDLVKALKILEKHSTEEDE